MDTQQHENAQGEGPLQGGALDALAVAPPPSDDAGAAVGGPAGAVETDEDRPAIRTGLDAGDVKALRRNPSDDDGKLDVALDETFPTSDAPSNTQPGKGKDPPPSSGYDAEAERDRANAQE